MSLLEKKLYENETDFIYKINGVNNKEKYVDWLINYVDKIELEDTTVRYEDGRNFHDGTESFVESKIDINKIKDIINSEIYLIMVSGQFKNVFVTIQFQLNIQKIIISIDNQNIEIIKELEQLLGLV